MRLCLSIAVAAVLSCLVVGNADASISYSVAGSSYAQNFDSLQTTPTATPVTNIAWANDSTITGWSLFNSSGAAITTYNAAIGGSNTGSFYSFGSVASSDRALGGAASGGAYFGSPASGAIAGWIAFAATNDTGGVLDSFTVGFNGEQWRNGGNATAQSMVLEYGFGGSFNSVSTWTAPGGSFDWTSPVATTTAAAIDGNAAGLVSSRGGTISGLTWADGDTLWLRWIENNDAGNDHGLAIDDFSFSATAAPIAVVPEPVSLVVWGGVGLIGIGVAIYKKKVA